MSYRYVTGLQREVDNSKELASTIKVGNYIFVGIEDSEYSEMETKMLKVTDVITEGNGKHVVTYVTVDDKYADCATIQFGANETYRRTK